MLRNKCFSFSSFEYHMFFGLHPFVTCLLTLSRIYIMRWEQNRHIGDVVQHERYFSVGLPTQVIAYPQKCLRRAIRTAAERMCR
jgi:hypothetical protein